MHVQEIPMSYPRSIEGSAGKRCRVLLGQTGSDYIFLANNDDGNITWQSHEWDVKSFHGIPRRLINRINECSETGQMVTEISFGNNCDCFMREENRYYCSYVSESFTEALKKHSNLERKVSIGDNGSWLILYGHNGYSYSYDNLSSDILTRLDENKGKIDFVRLLPYGQCFISYSDDTACEWAITKNESLSQELSRESSDPVTDVAIARDGSWIVMREHSGNCSGAGENSCS